MLITVNVHVNLISMKYFCFRFQWWISSISVIFLCINKQQNVQLILVEICGFFLLSTSVLEDTNVYDEGTLKKK